MPARLWHMNADCETELAAPANRYRRTLAQEGTNRRLAPHLLWLARPGDALLLEQPWPTRLIAEAARREVKLITDAAPGDQSHRLLTPWGWTESAAQIGERIGARVEPVPTETMQRVNSKLWSHALEIELGVALPGAATATTMEELRAIVARACPCADDKWVIKSPFGFAARERVLGRGSLLAGTTAEGWIKRRFARGETLIFQPWLEKLREYGVTLMIGPGGEIDIEGISDLLTNGAGTGIGYLLGRPPALQRIKQLHEIARIVGQRLFAEGYTGPAGVDAIEHTGGLHLLLEVNARYTMGFVAIAVERALKPQQPMIWEMTQAEHLHWPSEEHSTQGER
ncbi:MAG: hypothetical protein H0T63_01550 [Pyrinomonadaceae bacterium]|nr:hypothetical protein [Pyrinomonadaceae bacterium]MDQ3585947.1 hypothetical protein [Acidobacteriota bacterium]